jgi:hypothetical protein
LDHAVQLLAGMRCAAQHRAIIRLCGVTQAVLVPTASGTGCCCRVL